VGADGNISVAVSSNGPVTIGSIATAIDGLEGFGATVTATAGDGSYDIVNDPAATTTALAGGQFGGGLNASLVVELTGTLGSEALQFDKGASIEDVIQRINLVSDATGVSATNNSGTLQLNSTRYGSGSLIALDVISEGTGGTFESGLNTLRANGSDIVATINGTNANGKGNSISINTSTLDLELTVTDGSTADVKFDITGGGAQFQLGPDVVSTQQARLGIGSLNTAKLGGPAGRLYELGTGGAKSLTNDITGAAEVVEEVINKVTNLRGRLGAFQATTLDSNLVSLNDTVANLQQAESSIRDADFAAESAKLTRAQILVQSGTNVLALANQNPQNVLSLIR
jgi:flagellin